MLQWLDDFFCALEGKSTSVERTGLSGTSGERMRQFTAEKSSKEASPKVAAEKSSLMPWSGKPKIADKTVKVSESASVKDVLT